MYPLSFTTVSSTFFIERSGKSPGDRPFVPGTSRRSQRRKKF